MARAADCATRRAATVPHHARRSQLETARPQVQMRRRTVPRRRCIDDPVATRERPRRSVVAGCARFAFEKTTSTRGHTKSGSPRTHCGCTSRYRDLARKEGRCQSRGRSRSTHAGAVLQRRTRGTRLNDDEVPRSKGGLPVTLPGDDLVVVVPQCRATEGERDFRRGGARGIRYRPGDLSRHGQRGIEVVADSREASGSRWARGAAAQSA